MRIPIVLFGLLVGMAVAVVMFWWIDESPQDGGFDHPAYPEDTIQQAPDGRQRHRHVIATAGCFGALTCVFSVVCLSLGLNNAKRSPVAIRVLLVASLIYTGLFSLVVVLYWTTIHSSPVYLFGLPAPTAIMLLIFWPSPLVLVFLYMAAYPRWILPPDEEARFHDLVANRRARENR